MRKDFREVANSITTDCESWMREYEINAPAEIHRRRRWARGIKEFIKAILGIFVRPKFRDAETIYVFEGLRNKEYMRVFNPQSVVVVGSHQEKSFADGHGYGFCWSFPIVSATNSKMCRSLNYPIVKQLEYWSRELLRFQQVIFFLYEDTQPLGTFFVHLGRLMRPKATSVCIQHGYFVIQKFKPRYDGLLSDVNFVWDHAQADLIGCDKNSTYEIGLPYAASALPSMDIIVVLVGTGTAYDGNHDYERCLAIFSQVNEELTRSLGITVLYRPHPNEWCHSGLISELREKFPLLDEMTKLQRLNGPRALFVGTNSSLLYEAGVAGHLVAHLQLDDGIMPVFDFDTKFDSNGIHELVRWISNIVARPYITPARAVTIQQDPLDHFMRALNSAKLISNGIAEEFFTHLSQTP